MRARDLCGRAPLGDTDVDLVDVERRPACVTPPLAEWTLLGYTDSVIILTAPAGAATDLDAPLVLERALTLTLQDLDAARLQRWLEPHTAAAARDVERLDGEQRS